MNMIFILKKKTLLWRWKFIIIKFNFIAGIKLEDYKYKIIEEIMIINNSNMNA